MPQTQRTAPSWNFTSNCDAVPPRLHRERCGGLGEPNTSRWAHGTLGFGSSIAFSATRLGRDALGLHPRPMICLFQALDRRLPASPELMALLPSALQRLSASLRSPAFVRCTGLLTAGPSQFQRATPDHVGAFLRNPRCNTSASSFHERTLVSRFPTKSGLRHPFGPCRHSQATRSQHLNSTSAPLCLGVSKNSPVRGPFFRFCFPPPKSRSAWRSVDVPIR